MVDKDERPGITTNHLNLFNVVIMAIVVLVVVAFCSAGCADRRSSCTQSEWLVRSDCQ